MSQNKDIDGGPDEKPPKKTKYSNVGGEGNPPPSTPTKNATETESSDKMDAEPYGDDSKPGSSKAGETKNRRFLFKMLLTESDVEDKTLFFPFEVASPHFPPVEPISREKLQIFDTKGNEWIMTLTYSPLESTFVITTKWNEFVSLHRLQAADVIQFYRPDPLQHDKHYWIKYVRKVEVDESDYETDDDDLDLDQMGGNFLFELELKRRDIGNRLAIPEEHVGNHLPKIKKPTDEPVIDEYYFTDVENKDWCMKTMFNQLLNGFVIVDGWEGFVKGHKLTAMDVIKLYKPTQPSHAIHFLVVIVKKEEARNKVTRTNTAKNLWGDSAVEFDEAQGGSSESGCDNDMEIDEKTAPRQSSIPDPEDNSSCESGS